MYRANVYYLLEELLHVNQSLRALGLPTLVNLKLCSQAFSCSQHWLNLSFVMTFWCYTSRLLSCYCETKQNKNIEIWFKTYLKVSPCAEAEMLHGQTKDCSKSARRSNELCSSPNVLSDWRLRSQHHCINTYH